MKKEFLSERACFPAFHTGGRDSNPVNTPCLVGYISSDFLEASAPKELAPAGNVVLSFKTIPCRAIPLFVKNSPSNSESGVFLELLHQKFQVVRVKRYVRVEVANHFIVEILNFL